jgi:alanine dehydrogenase
MKKTKKNPVSELAQQAVIYPKESMVQESTVQKKTSIGIPVETTNQETRVSFTPQGVEILCSNGYQVLVEAGAGKHAKYSDHEYSEAGAKIVYSKKDVYSCDIVIKVAFPSIEEIELLNTNQILVSALDLPHLNSLKVNMLLAKKVTAFCYEYMQDDFSIFPVIQSMSEIAGRVVIFLAAEYLAGSRSNGILLGGITGVIPAEVVILGAGTVGQYAAKTAHALGAEVKVFDNSLYKLRRLYSTHSLSVYNSIIQPDLILKALKTADVVIGALRPEYGRTPCIVTEDMVMQMKDGAIIMDVSIDQGGCFETSRVTSLEKPTYVKYNVIHYCVPNIPSTVPQTASNALNNILTPVLSDIIKFSSLSTYLWEKPLARTGIYLYKGILTNSYIGNKFGLNSSALDLLLTSQIS